MSVFTSNQMVGEKREGMPTLTYYLRCAAAGLLAV